MSPKRGQWKWKDLKKIKKKKKKEMEEMMWFLARKRDRVWGCMLFEEQTQENVSSDALEVRGRASRGNRILEVEHWAGSQKPWFLIQAIPAAHFITLNKALHLPQPQCPHYRMEPVNPNSLTRWLRRANELR